jgi:hypothetical protein
LAFLGVDDKAEVSERRKISSLNSVQIEKKKNTENNYLFILF